jgi:hypothetical protein
MRFDTSKKRETVNTINLAGGQAFTESSKLELEALKKLVDGTLAPAETWEAKLAQPGSAAESEEAGGRTEKGGLRTPKTILREPGPNSS